uniref:Uncharacterized protein n=1 Tax=Arundo donax TaxID=35708 RepID=A0A0A9C2E0_ARUDO
MVAIDILLNRSGLWKIHEQIKSSISKSNQYL